MLHVAPPPPSSAPLASAEFSNPFDPIAYLGYCRAHGMQIRGGIRDGVRWLSWDLVGAHADAVLRHHPDPRLDIDADPDNEPLVWEALRAEAYLDASKECGLVLFPCAHGYVVIVGEDEESNDRDFSAGTMRMLEHRNGTAKKDCRRGIVFRVLCARLGVEPDDPGLSEKINEHFLQLEADRMAS